MTNFPILDKEVSIRPSIRVEIVVAVSGCGKIELNMEMFLKEKLLQSSNDLRQEQH